MHLRKLFQAIYELKTLENDNTVQVVTFASREGELVNLKRPVTVENEVEMWLCALEKETKYTLASMLSDCSMAHGDISTYPGQILALWEAIQFSGKVERAIKTGKLPLLHRELQV